MIIGVDIDGTLTLETEGQNSAERTPRKEVIEKINDLYRDGNTIVLHTSRRLEDMQTTKFWLFCHRVLYHHIIFDKPKFDLYVGDEVRRPEEL